ncbi:MAG: ChaN family lipoprotein, partial [Desulfopila sp.]|nr:ChaN family lipoprotein [Desulfopila sp.]
MKNRSSLLTVSTGILLFFLLASTASAKESPDFFYELALSFDISGKLLTGTARITVPPGENLTIRLDTISPTGILLQKGEAAPGTVTFAGASSIRIPAEDMEQKIYISYEKHIQHQKDNFISERGITLLHSWYPFPSKKVRFSLRAALPPGFTAISPSDTAPTTTDSITRFSFSIPLRSLQFVAAPFVVNSIEVRPDLTAYTYFFPEDEDLAREYLLSARKYILRYEKLIGPYPYNHFAIVANSRPTGYGMPTFTLLGQNVLRLPFIKHTSLGHEILHSWFGNAVTIKPTSSNWVEGLTTYLADWLYREDIEEGAIVRKENSIKFLSYVTEDTAVPLQSFFSADHNQPMAEALRSIGYSKGAMLFHELKIRVGEETFYEAIRHFYSLYRNKEAGWEDIRIIFEKHSDISLVSFFLERLTRTDIPDLTVENISTTPDAGGFKLQFTVEQHTDDPFQLLLPVRVETSAGPQTFKLQITAVEEKIELQLDSAPFKLIVDPEYDLLRRLHPSERVPVWSLFQGPAGATVVIPRAQKEVFASFLDTFSEKGKWQIEEEETFDINQASDTHLILVGDANRVSRSYFGGINHPPEGFTLEGRNHPLNTEKSVLLVSGNDAAEVAKGVAKLRHYGKYNFLHFVNGMAVKKSFAPGNMGQHIQVAHKPAATPADTVLSLDTVLELLRDTQVIYIGETHTSVEDHHLQHLILEGIFRRNPNIAIGLEMFPKSSQMSLDQYTLGKNSMEEKLFLKQSRYFEVWGYDYRYYKNIIDFAKKYHLPLVALNIDKAIVSAISETGSADILSEKQRLDLPQERDLSL